jgi:DNA-directed RNA polymerase specialized sigma24 family protein
MMPRSEASSEESTRLVEELKSRDGLSAEFTRFVKRVEPRLSYAFFAAYGPEVGSDVTADCLVYAWEHWPHIQEMDNAVGYLFRVGQSKARGYHRPQVSFPQTVRPAPPEVEPKLPGALERLTQNQRLAVVLVHGLGWTEEETAALIGRSRSTVRTHLERGLRRLRDELGVRVDA